MYIRCKNCGRSVFVFILIITLFLGLFSLKPLKIYGEETGSVEDFVSRFYEVCLSRQPDETGIVKFSSDLKSGVKTGADIAKEIINSNEFKSRNLSNQDYLIVLYKAFFNRDPDEQGFVIWLDRLDKGSSRNYILSGFINSTEFVNLCRNYNIRAGYLPGTPAEPSTRTQIIGSPIFIQNINQALTILSIYDNPVYCQVSQVKKIEERPLGSKNNKEWAGMADGTSVYVDLVKISNMTPSEVIIIDIAIILSHEFNHVVNRYNYNKLGIAEYEKLACIQGLNTAINISAPNYFIDFINNQIINIYDPQTWWWGILIPAF